MKLFENGVISHKVFSQKFLNNEKGQLSIGEIPKYIVNDYTHYGRCPLFFKNKFLNNKWECKIDSIYFGNDEQNIIPFSSQNEQSIIFRSYTPTSLVPRDFFEKLGEIYLKKEIEEKNAFK